MHTHVCDTHTCANTTLGKLRQPDLPLWSCSLSETLPFPQKPHHALLGTPQHQLRSGGEGLGPAPRHCPHEPFRLHFPSTAVAGHLRCPVARSAGHSVGRARPREGAAQTGFPGFMGRNRKHGAGEERHATGLWALVGRTSHGLGVSKLFFNKYVILSTKNEQLPLYH